MFLSPVLNFMVAMSLGYSFLLDLVCVGCMGQHVSEGRLEEVVNDNDEDCKPYIFRKAGYDMECVYIICLKNI